MGIQKSLQRVFAGLGVSQTSNYSVFWEVDKADMETVELHCEDKPFDMKAYVDTAGHTYDFDYGMNWSGVTSIQAYEKLNGTKDMREKAYTYKLYYIIGRKFKRIQR